MNESRVSGRAHDLLSIPRQGLNRLVHSSTECINDYHNSSHIRHGMCLQLIPFLSKQCTRGLVYSFDFLFIALVFSITMLYLTDFNIFSYTTFNFNFFFSHTT